MTSHRNLQLALLSFHQTERIESKKTPNLISANPIAAYQKIEGEQDSEIFHIKSSKIDYLSLVFNED
jgi:hypothetical protein